MQIRSRTWALIVWLHMLRAVRGQDCTLQAFLEGPLFDPNFDTSALQSRYASGRQVQVSCSIGYSGFFKLICVEGMWQARGSKCEQTKCHLPSTQLEGTSYDPAHITLFSTGTSVTVQCGDAHWIVNPQQRSAVSTCLDDGEWSIRPLCREVTCRNRPDDNVYSSSVQWWETKRLGDTATYHCRPGFTSTNGASEMTCTRDGWEPNPPCEDVNEVICQVPVIENGVVPVEIRDYKEQEILQFSCQSAYKRIEERPSKCTKVGTGAEWVPAPECEEVKCLLPLTPLQGTSYDPAHITQFSPGTTVTVQCGELHWIGSPNQRSAVLTCLENGEWSSDETVCQEVTCRNLRDRNVYYWSVRWGDTIRLGDTAIYRCQPGFSSTNGASRMTCTRDGWEPNPPCEERCRVPVVDGSVRLDLHTPGTLVDKGAKVPLSCRLRSQVLYDSGEVECLGDGQWSSPFPTCGHKSPRDCQKAPPLPGGDTKRSTKLRYPHGAQVEYICSRYHLMEGGPFKTCQNAEWIGDIRCLRPCTVDRDLMNQYHITFRLSQDDKIYSEHNDVIEFACIRGTRPSSNTPMRQRCIDGQITLPSCQ